MKASHSNGREKITIKGYSGICACCFEPIRNGEETQLRDGGRKFHEKCVLSNPNSYYIKLEKRLAKRRKEVKS